VTVDLSSWVTLGANSVDEVVSWKTSAGSDCGVPNLVALTFSMTISVGDIVNLSWRTETTTITDHVVTLSADTLSILVDLVRVAGWGAETEVLDISRITNTRFGFFIVS